MLPNSKTQILTTLKTQIVTKLKKTNCDKTQQIKLWQNSTTQIVRKFNKPKFWQYSLTQMRVTILSLQEIVVSSSVLKILNGHCNVGTILCWSHILNCPGTVYIQHHTYDPILLGSIGHPFLLVSVGSLKPGRFPAHFRIDNRVLPYWHLGGIQLWPVWIRVRYNPLNGNPKSQLCQVTVRLVDGLQRLQRYW